MKILRLINILLAGWILAIFLYKPFLSVINCADKGWSVIRNFECGNIAYVYDILANTFTIMIPFLLLPITLTIWLYGNRRSKNMPVNNQTQEQPKHDYFGAIKIGLIISIILFCVGFVYIAFQFSSG